MNNQHMENEKSPILEEIQKMNDSGICYDYTIEILKIAELRTLNDNLDYIGEMIRGIK